MPGNDIVLALVLASGTAAAAADAVEPIVFTCGDVLTVDGSSNYSWTFDAFQAPKALPLAGGPFALLHGGRWLSSSDGSLVLSGAEQGNGTDAHGVFTRLTLAWAASDAERPLWTTSFRCYPPSTSTAAVVFSQQFPAGLHDAPGGPRDFQQPSSRFPSFVASTLADRAMITFKDGNAGHTLHAGVFPATYLGTHRQQTVRGGLGGYTGGPLAIGLDAGDLASGPILVLSPLNAFMASLHNVHDGNSTISFGVGGLMSELPEGYTSDFVAVLHLRGKLEQRHSGAAASAFIAWGDFLLAEYSQQRTPPDANTWISRLGYSTTGTFHYNPCDCPGNLNRSYCSGGNNSRMPGCHTYQDTLLQVQAYAKTAGIPYQWWLIDSWWHAFDNNTYFEDIPFQVGRLFPDGLKSLYQQLGNQPFGAHWSSTFNSASPYVTSGLYGNDSAWAFSESKTSVTPLASPVWDHIFGANTAWGMDTIKMDHNNEVFQGDPMVNNNKSLESAKGAASLHLRMLTDPLAASSFILSMAAAATRHKTSIMPCMSNPNVLLHSVMAPAITHARASPDSHPNNENYRGFGGAATWQWAVGIWPFKDVFYTNSSSAINTPNAGADKGMREDQPWTHTVVAALSGGGVAPGDVVGGSDTALILQTCRADGTLLKPTTPAAYIDRTWQELMKLPDKGGEGCGVTGLGETSSADIVLGGGLLYKIFYVLPPTAASTISPADVGLPGASGTAPSYVIYAQEKYGGAIRSVARFGPGSSSVRVEERACKGPQQCDKTQLFIVAPVLTNGWAVLGETTKIVAVSAQRIVSIVAGTKSAGSHVDTAAAVKLVLIGTAGEQVEIAFMDPTGGVVTERCVIGMSGRVTMLAGAPPGAAICHVESTGVLTIGPGLKTDDLRRRAQSDMNCDVVIAVPRRVRMLDYQDLTIKCADGIAPQSTRAVTSFSTPPGVRCTLVDSTSPTVGVRLKLDDETGPKPPHCPQYHTLSYNDPSGPVQIEGTWHIFPINGNWGHCTSPDLLMWNCSHPSTGWQFDNTGGITVTPVGYFLTQANNYNISMAKAASANLDVWVHANGSTCGSVPGDSQCWHGPAYGPGSQCPSAPCRPANQSAPFEPCRTPVCGVIGNPAVPFPGTESLSDTGRALKLKSGLYLPVGARGPKNAGGGIHWFKAKDDTMTHIEEVSFLFSVNIAANGTSTGPLMECPDVFQLGGKTVVLGSLPGDARTTPALPVNTEGTSHWWVGSLSDDDLTFTAEATGRFDYGPGGYSSIYAAKSGTSALEPFTRRVLFGFGGWREGMSLAAECGSGFYVLPRELSISSTGKLLQHPVAELKGLRQGAAVQGPRIATGAQIEILVQCEVPATPPTKGILSVTTLETANKNQTVQVGYNFGAKHGFATVPAGLNYDANTSRSDVTPQLELFNWTSDTIELRVYVDGPRIESFFGGETTITTSTRNGVAGDELTSRLVNTEKLVCNVTSWVLALPEARDELTTPE
jgi:sucrose-6-phosphate hydrolase SacC (GH32 family)